MDAIEGSHLDYVTNNIVVRYCDGLKQQSASLYRVKGVRTFGLPVVPEEKQRNAIADLASPALNMCSTCGRYIAWLAKRSSSEEKRESGASCPPRITKRSRDIWTFCIARRAVARLPGCAMSSTGVAICSW